MKSRDVEKINTMLMLVLFLPCILHFAFAVWFWRTMYSLAPVLLIDFFLIRECIVILVLYRKTVGCVFFFKQREQCLYSFFLFFWCINLYLRLCIQETNSIALGWHDQSIKTFDINSFCMVIKNKNENYNYNSKLR